jgi:hypothetical protein
MASERGPHASEATTMISQGFAGFYVLSRGRVYTRVRPAPLGQFMAPPTHLYHCSRGFWFQHRDARDMRDWSGFEGSGILNGRLQETTAPCNPQMRTSLCHDSPVRTYERCVSPRLTFASWRLRPVKTSPVHSLRTRQRQRSNSTIRNTPRGRRAKKLSFQAKGTSVWHRVRLVGDDEHGPFERSLQDLRPVFLK